MLDLSMASLMVGNRHQAVDEQLVAGSQLGAAQMIPAAEWVGGDVEPICDQVEIIAAVNAIVVGAAHPMHGSSFKKGGASWRQGDHQVIPCRERRVPLQMIRLRQSDGGDMIMPGDARQGFSRFHLMSPPPQAV